MATLEGHRGDVNVLAVLEGGRLASGSDDRTLKVWELVSGACVATLEGHARPVTSLAILEGRRMASGADDGEVKIWDSALSDVLD